MIEFNGWINLSISPDENSYEEVSEAAKKLTGLMAPLQMNSQFFEIKNFNGNHVLLIGGAHNHDVGYSDAIVKLLHTISTIAPASYGLIYVRLPEDPITWNYFQVYRMTRGKVTIEKDSFLSPCRPTIED